MQEWTERRLQRLFQLYNRKFWNCRLTGWTADFDVDHPGGFGYCNRKTKRISVRLANHTSDQSVRATLVDEMAHAASSLGHGKKWRLEMQRLRRAGAPTDPLDFLVPYNARSVVTSFMEAASAGAPWEEALNNLEVPSARILGECKRFYNMAKRNVAK
jgi:hypothetical protein